MPRQSVDLWRLQWDIDLQRAQVDSNEFKVSVDFTLMTCEVVDLALNELELTDTVKLFLR